MSPKKRFFDLDRDRYLSFHASEMKETGKEDAIEPAENPKYLGNEIDTCVVTIFAEYYDYSSFVTRQAL